jgi:nitric oxide reductase NorD protein
MTSESSTELARVVELLAPALSGGRRRTGRLVTGGSRAFFTSKGCTKAYVPFPLPAALDERISAVRVATCGLALQSCPTKEALAELPLTDLRPAERAALSQVEGEIAMAWAIEQFPGLERDLRALLPTLRPTREIAGRSALVRGSFVADGRLLLEAALERARTRSRAELIVPELLGLLPLDESSRRSLRSYFRALGRMPYSVRKTQPRPTALGIPVGGNDGARSRNVPPRDRPEESDPEATSDRRVGIPYDEWNRFTRRYRRGHVSVLERHVETGEGKPLRPAPELLRWFRQSPSRVWRSRLEDGTELDVDAFVDEWVGQAAGNRVTGHVYRSLDHGDRDVATAILLDASASLGADGGLHLRLELACADALATALAHTGESHAVFAFTGHGRHRVEVNVLKDFREPRAALPGQTGLTTAGYTRLGAPIRHVTKRLLEVPAERRILLSLGDGLPSDEGYEGAYAWADVLRAVEEAEESGVTVYHIGIGRVRVDPLKECFGLHRSRRVVSVRDLPRVMAQVHERLRAA